MTTSWRSRTSGGCSIGPSSCTRHRAAPVARSTSTTSPLTLATSTLEAIGIGPAVAVRSSAKERARAGPSTGTIHRVPLRARAYTGSRATAGAPDTAAHVVGSRARGDAVYGAPAVARDTVYALARNGTLWIVPVDGPARARSFALDLTATAGPMPIASGVLVASVSGDVVLVDR